MKKILISTFAATVLSSCGFMTPAKQYPGGELAASDIAVIKGHMGTPFSGEYHATISGYTKSETTHIAEQKKFGLPGFTDYPKEIHVLAGEYEVQVYCFKGLTSYRPKTTLVLQGGKTYVLQCEVRNGRALIQVNASAT